MISVRLKACHEVCDISQMATSLHGSASAFEHMKAFKKVEVEKPFQVSTRFPGSCEVAHYHKINI